MASVKVDGLAAAIAQELQAYSDEVVEDVKESVTEAAKTCVATLKATSPRSPGPKGGAYAKGWRKRTAYESANDIRMQVYNATDYQLTHLLEDGHANVDGGRTEGQPHIQPAADEAAQLLEKDVKIRVGKR